MPFSILLCFDIVRTVTLNVLDYSTYSTWFREILQLHYVIWLRFKWLLLELLTLWRLKNWKHFSFQCFQFLEEHFFIWRFPGFFACLWDKVRILKKTLWSNGGMILIVKNWITQTRNLSQCHIIHYKPQVEPPATEICLHYMPIPHFTDILFCENCLYGETCKGKPVLSFN